MNENLESLKQKAAQLFHDKHWNELIPVCTELIGLEQETHEKARAHFQRGVAYLHKRQFDQAIADFAKALELKDDYAEAYHNRGAVYYLKDDLDQAIADFTEALRIGPNDAESHRGCGIAWREKGDHARAIAYLDKSISLQPENSMMYVDRGITYYERGTYDQAIADFSKATNLDPTNALAWHNRGQAHSHRGRISNDIADFDKAIHNFDEAIRLNPQEASTYSGRGGAYIEKGNYDLAFKDFVSADECDPNLKRRAPVIYIASQIAAIYKGANQEDDKVMAFKFYFELFKTSDAVKINRFWRPETEVAHYTSLHTLKALATKKRFRLYNANYMNDPEEGRVFFEIMKSLPQINIDIENLFYQDSKLHPSPAYIGSFVITDENEQELKDELFLWRTYGKHDAEEAAGACLIFSSHDFAEAGETQIGGMSQQTPTGDSQPFQLSQQRQSAELPTLYKVTYIEGESKGLIEELGDLAKCLKRIEDEVLNKADHKKGQLRSLVCQMLDSVRFLFKKSHYQAEKEVRIIQVHYFRENEESSTDGIKVDTEQIPPRFYLETHENFRFSKVILGPKTHGVSEWQRWLKEQGHNKIEPSKIKYGTKYL